MEIEFNPEPNQPITLEGGYRIARATLDGNPSILFECPGCKGWGNIDNDMFHGNVSIDCVDCDYHETVNLAGLLADLNKT